MVSNKLIRAICKIFNIFDSSIFKINFDNKMKKNPNDNLFFEVLNTFSDIKIIYFYKFDCLLLFKNEKSIPNFLVYTTNKSH